MSNDTNDNPSHKSAMLRTACRFASDILLDAWDGDEDGMESNDKNALDRMRHALAGEYASEQQEWSELTEAVSAALVDLQTGHGGDDQAAHLLQQALQEAGCPQRQDADELAGLDTEYSRPRP